MDQEAHHTTLEQARKAYEDYGNIRMDQSHSTETEYVDALEATVSSSQAEIAKLRTALEFYRDGFEFHTNPRHAGLEWKPTETLLDDCGNVARLALSEGQ